MKIFFSSKNLIHFYFYLQYIFSTEKLLKSKIEIQEVHYIMIFYNTKKGKKKKNYKYLFLPSPYIFRSSLGCPGWKPKNNFFREKKFIHKKGFIFLTSHLSKNSVNFLKIFFCRLHRYKIFRHVFMTYTTQRLPTWF